MTIDNFKKIFYSIKVSYILNFLLGLTMLDVILFCFPIVKIDDYINPFGLIILCMPLFIGILPALSYNLIRFRMVKSGELNYGICRYTLSTVLPFIAPMLIYSIAYLNGFRLDQ